MTRSRFASVRVVALIVIILIAAVACRGSDSAAANDTDPAVVQPAVAKAMGEVQSVRFLVNTTGANIFIDSSGTLGLSRIEGRFQAPSNADAIIDVSVLGLQTQIGAVALDGQTWLSNPVTGTFETLPDSINVDPSEFFDPSGGWSPLIANAENVRYIETVERDGVETWHYQGTGQPADVARVTSNLVRDTPIDFDVWVDPTTSLVIGLDFDTDVGGQTSSWSISLSEYGEQFTITDPTLDGG